MVFDFIVIVPLLLSLHDFFFGCGCGVSFFGVFQHPPVNGCSIGLVFSLEKMSTHSSTMPS